MSSKIQDFISFMSSVGCTPKDSSLIKETDTILRYTIQGDANGKRNGAYILNIYPNGYVSGGCQNHRDGGWHKYSSKADKVLTDQERRDWAKTKAEDDEKRKKQRAIDLEKAKKKLEYIYSKSSPARSDNPYLIKKGISGIGAKEYKGNLVVFGRKKGVISTAQFINNTDKRFIKNLDKKGSYGSVNKSKDTSVIYVCEGYATAHSVWDATRRPAIYAWDKGNLIHVLKELTEKYKESDIIICADNDQWCRLNPTDKQKTYVGCNSDKNVGISYAKEAALKYGLKFVYPDFSKEHSLDNKDFNDYAKLFGLEKTRQRLSQASLVDDRGAAGYPLDDQSVVADGSTPPIYERTPLTAYEDEFVSKDISVLTDWKEAIIPDGKGYPVKTSLQNKILFLQYEERYKGIFRYDEFAHDVVVCRCPPWENESRFMVHSLSDSDISQTAADIERFGLSPDINAVDRAIRVVANNNAFHPAREYLNTLKWDGVERLKTWLSYYLGAEEDNLDYLSFVGKKWMTAAVKRVFEPGCKFDHILVIEGEQGRGKSTALETLATFGVEYERAYFTDSITVADIQNKDTIQKIQGSVIVELAELAGFNKKDDEEIKRWITLKHDDIRLPYAKTTSRFSRQFVLSATTNSYDYLKDPTGNRRYWPIKSNSVDIPSIKRDRSQLWAEAVHLYREGLYIGPTEEEQILAKEAQDKRRFVDVWEEDILDTIDKMGMKRLSGFTTAEILDGMGIKIKDRGLRESRRVSQILRQIGYDYKSIRDGKSVVKAWVRSTDD